jgi:hypothetical protein
MTRCGSRQLAAVSYQLSVTPIAAANLAAHSPLATSTAFVIPTGVAAATERRDLLLSGSISAKIRSPRLVVALS